MKILVVEDKEKNIEAAKRALGGHELTIVTGYDQAHEVLIPVVDPNEFRAAFEKATGGWKIIEEDSSIPNHKIWYLRNSEGEEMPHFEAPKEIRLALRKAEVESKHMPFDVVLTDVMLPKGGNQCMNAKGEELVSKQGEMPYGPIIVLRALQAGVKKVGIITQGNHHDDPFVFAFDRLFGFSAGDTKLVASNHMETKDGLKDWGRLLAELVEE
ncbi:MAG: hypothetical protein HY764_03835 [Candidatus Portnoybacteria bacterium]|nr:hypothetical protein [Candidatus Portnoybacteria bacterium]